MEEVEKHENVWAAISDTPVEAANMRAKAELIRKIVAILEQKNWTQTEAASHCGIKQPRMNDLLRGRMSRFSLDALVNIAAALGYQVHIDLECIQEKSVEEKFKWLEELMDQAQKLKLGYE